MTKKYSGKIELWIVPRYVNGIRTGNGELEIDLNSLSAQQCINILEASIEFFKTQQERDSRGRFIKYEKETK